MAPERNRLVMPRGLRPALIVTLILVAFGSLYILLPALAGLDEVWGKLREGDPWWLIAAAALEAASFFCYMVVFRAVFGAGSTPIDWRLSYRITMAGVAATRLLAIAGVGGIVLTVWALDRVGMARREIAARTSTFLVLLYGIYMSVLVIGGVGLRTGLFPGSSPFGLTVVPALFGAAVIVAALAVALLSRDLDSAATRFDAASRRTTRWTRAAATLPATLNTGVRGALAMIRARRPELLGAVGWWAFDVCVLLVCLKAFGGDPAVAVVVMAYFVGMAANTLPVPGGIGAVDGGMIGALIGFGVESHLAIAGVLSYRLFSFWLPILPGAVAYAALLRSGKPS